MGIMQARNLSQEEFMKRFQRLLTLLAVGAFALILAACPQPTGTDPTDTVQGLFEDFALIPYDADGDGDTTYTFDGEEIQDVVNPAGGKILTYDADGDGTPDQVDGKVLRLVSGRFAFDDGDADYAGYTDKVVFNAENIWYLNGTVFIGENTEQTSAARTESTVLEIAAGADVRGVASAGTPGTLVIDRNGQIDATGTATNPIVFSSSKAAGDRKSVV